MRPAMHEAYRQIARSCLVDGIADAVASISSKIPVRDESQAGKCWINRGIYRAAVSADALAKLLDQLDQLDQLDSSI